MKPVTVIWLVVDPVDSGAGEGQEGGHGEQFCHGILRFKLARTVVAEPKYTFSFTVYCSRFRFNDQGFQFRVKDWESEIGRQIKVQVCTHLERKVPGPGLGEEAVSLAEALHDQALDVVHLEKETVIYV